MKKVFLLLFILIPLIGISQIQVGIRAGYTASTISFKPDNKSKLIYGDGVDLGLVIKHYDLKYVGFQGELYLTERGYRVPYNDTSQFKRINSYLELPIFIQAHLNLAGGLYLHLNLGCYAAYLLSAKEGYDTTGVLVMNDVKFNILRDNRFDYGLAGGVGLSYEFSWGTIQAEVRVMYGYADLFKYKYTDMPDQSKSVVENINISYMYNFSKIGERKKAKLNAKIMN